MMIKEEPKNNSKFKDGDIVAIVKHNEGWMDYYIGIVIGPYICGSDLSKIPINKALYFEIRYATEHEKRKFLSEWEELKELPYTDEEAKEFANMVSHEWWQVAMDKWNTLAEDEKKKYNQYIGFNDFSDHLMNILRSVLLGLKRNGKLIYEEGSLFSEPEQKPAKCIKATRDLSQQHKETLSEREEIRNEIVKQITETVDFMNDACTVMDGNTAFIQFINECSNELVNNTVYSTVMSDDLDCWVREFDMYLTYIRCRCDNVIETVKDFRRLTTNRFLYMILNRIENDLEKVKKMVYYMVNKTNNKNE